MTRPTAPSPWNCNGAFRRKFDQLREFDADILVIQECEDPARSKDFAYQAFASNYLWVGPTKNKGIGVFARHGIPLTKIAFDDVMYVKPEFRKTRAAYVLIQTFIGWAAAMGVNRIQCGTTTGVESRACIRLYEHFGFTQYGTVLDMEL